MRAVLRTLLLVASLASLIAGVSAAQEAGRRGDTQRVGRLIRISAPITPQTERRIKRIVDGLLADTKFQPGVGNQWPVLIFEIEPGQTNFGIALDLARYISSPKLSGITKVAFLPESISGHAVLVAIACDEIAMHPDATIGEAGIGEQVIRPGTRSGYVETARETHSVPVDLVLGMLDPQVEVLVVETDVSREFVLRSRLEELKEEKTIGETRVLVPAGEAGVFTGRAGRELGFVRYLAQDRIAVAKALGLPRESVEDDPSDGGNWRPIRVDIKGPITARMVEQARSMIDSQIREQDVNFVCLWIDSPGGSPDESHALAGYLADLDPGQVRTVAYIPGEARADAAFVAIGCDHIVMQPDALLGGPGAYQIAPVDTAVYATALAEIARRKGASPSLAAAMIDPELQVFRYERGKDALEDYFSEEEMSNRDDADAWRKGKLVTHAGKPLQLDGDEAVELALVRSVVRDFREFKGIYGLENDPTLIEPGWADLVVDALNSPWLTGMLLVLGGLALYIELQAPGIGLGAFTAAVCFLLFFWSRYLGGTADMLEILLFVGGIACLVLEVFLLPGFGIFGLGGGALVIASLILASQTFVVPSNEYQSEQLRISLLTMVGAGAGVIAVGIGLRRHLHRAPVFNHMLLQPPVGEELEQISQREALASFEHLVGQRGLAMTQLSPAGKARFGDEFVDVMADSEIIERGAEIVVVEARGNRVIVAVAS